MNVFIASDDITFSDYDPMPFLTVIPTTATSGTTTTNKWGADRIDTHESVPLPSEVIPMDYSTMAQKMVHLATFTITESSSGFLGKYPHPGSFIGGQVAPLIKAATYFRGDLVVRFSVKGTGWQGGAALAAFVPFAKIADVTPLTYSLRRLSTLPHIIIDYASNTPVTMKIPYRHFLNYMSDPDLVTPLSPSVPLGTLVIAIMSPLQVPVDTAGGTLNLGSVDLEIYYAWERFEPIVPSEVVATMLSAAIEGKPDVMDGPVPRTPLDRVANTIMNRRQVDPEAAGSTPVDSASSNVLSDGDSTSILPASFATNTSSTPGLGILSPIMSAPMESLLTTPNSLREIMKRPTPFQMFDISLNANSATYYQLWSNGNPFDKWPSEKVFTPYYNFASMFAGYVGDIVLDIVIRDPTSKNVHAWATVVDIVDDSFTPNLYEALPIPLSAMKLSNGAKPLAGALNTGFSGGARPTVTLAVPGSTRLVIPFRCQNRFATTQIGPVQANSRCPSPFIGTPFLVFYSELASTIDATIWISVADSFKFGVYRGIPQCLITPLWSTDGTPHWTNHPDGSVYSSPI